MVNEVPKRFVKVPGYRSILASAEGEIYFKKTKYITKGGIAGRYLRVSVMEYGERTLEYVHVLIATAFHGKPKKGMVCGHRDDNRLNNKASNLEWITQSQNIKDTYARGIRKPTYKVSKEQWKQYVPFYLRESTKC